MKRIISFFLLIFSGLALFQSCGSGHPEIIQVDPGFREYISAYTSGMISRKSPIRIELNEPVKGLEQQSSEELAAYFEVEPAVKGTVVAVSDRIIDFIPDEMLPVNHFFTATLRLGELRSVKDGFEDFRFQFATYEQKVNVELEGLRNYYTFDIVNQQLRGSISTTDAEDSTLLKKIVKVTLDGKTLPCHFDRFYGDHNVRFVVDSIRRGEKAKKLVVSWDGTPIHSFSAGQEEIEVPALGDFTVERVDVSQGENQEIALTFSEPIEPTQDLQGIITLSGSDKLSWQIDRNVVTLFLNEYIEGTHKLQVSRGIHNIAGFPMNEAWSEELELKAPFPQLRIRGNGTILPNSQGLIFPFEAIALKAVDVRVIRIYEHNVHHFLQTNDLNGSDELTRFGKVIAKKKLDLSADKSKNLRQWNTHVIDLGKLINTEPGAIYEVALDFRQSYALCDCADSAEVSDENDYGTSNGESWSEQNWHPYGFNGFETWHSYYDEDEDPCESGYYYGKAVKRNILASDIGMIFKLDEDKRAHVFLSDMVTTQPVSGADVYFYDYTKNQVGHVKSDAQGMASLQLRQKPFLMVAHKGKQRGYLKLTDGLVNSLSKFDVSGEPVQDGVKGFIYGERGVWRPGDSLFITFMLQDNEHSLPAEHPVSFELSDPSGNVLYKTSTTHHVNGVYDFRTRTADEAPTGNYQARVKVGNKQFSKSLRIETIKPNRLKIRLEKDSEKGKDRYKLHSEWLHGANAGNLKATVSEELVPLRTVFKGYEQYQFDSPVRRTQSDQSTIFQGTLDSTGTAIFERPQSQFKEAAGMLQARYLTRVYEKSGNFSIDRTTLSHSPYKAYLGLSVPNGSVYDETLETGSTHWFDVIRLDESGKLLSDNASANVRIYKLDWNWWYDSGKDDMSQFTARNSSLLVKDTSITLQKGKGRFPLRIVYPQYGQYLVLVTDAKGGHQTGSVVHVDWPYWSRSNRSDNEFAKMLSFATDKQSYNKGENIRISFPSPSAGRALITVENGRKVLQKIWISTKKGETTYSLPATGEMAPNIYLHVTLIQAHHNTVNDLPIRMYGVLPIRVDDPSNHLHPQLRMKEQLKPESRETITVSEQNGRAMTYTLAVVDDGLLDLTGYRTPDPWHTFYAKEALGVKTWDMYDYVIGAYSGKLNNLLSPGGDAEAITGNGPKANRFKPMVRFLGPFSLPAGSKRSHAIDIPNYVGSVRVMVVARQDDAYGETSRSVPVKKPLMLLATLPRVLGPGEEFQLPVDVFALEKFVKDVRVEVESNEFFELVGPKTLEVHFNEPGDKLVYFNYRVKKAIGTGKFTIRAAAGKERAQEQIEIDVRPPNPTVREIQHYELAAGESTRIPVTFDGYHGSNRALAEISTLPGIDLEKRLKYLIEYPHGCVEQTTSAVFPQLYLARLSKITDRQQKEIEKHIRAGIRRLQQFQTHSGGFSYWPGEGRVSEWGTNYAGHFLLEAELAGYDLPGNLKSRWVHYQQEQARSWYPENTSDDGEELTQAYRLYLLALNHTPETGAMNRLREQPGLSTAARWRLACAYSFNGQRDVAQKLIAGISIHVNSYRELSGTFGSSFRDEAMILEALSILDERKKAADVLRSLSTQLRSDQWLSTQETAYALLAVARYTGNEDASVSVPYNWSFNGGAGQDGRANAKIGTIELAETKQKSNYLTIRNNGKTRLYVAVTTEKIPIENNMKAEASGLSVQLSYETTDGKPLNVEKLSQGTEFVAIVKVHNLSNRELYEELALQQVFASGWEIVNERMGGNTANNVRYQDIRDDRVLSYYQLAPNETREIRVLLHATYAGKFYLPGIYTEAMYDHRIRASLAGKWIVVKPD